MAGIPTTVTKFDQVKLDVSFIPKQRNTSCNIDYRVSWADLPADILFIIFGLLRHINNHDFLDLYQCLAVCRSWRIVAKQIWRNHILPTTPWLLHEEIKDYKILVNTNPYKWQKDLHLETNDNASCFSFNLDSDRMKNYASYDGWLLLGTSLNQPLLYNPVTKTLLQLPPLPTELRLHSHMKFVSSRSTPTDPNCIICLKFSKKRDFINCYGTVLAFCRPVSSSSSWVILEELVEDIVFCGGRFYAIATSGALFVYNDNIINGSTVPYASWTWTKMKIGGEICGINSRSMLDVHCFFFYLVESKTGDLLLIKRIFERNYTTKSFCIFKLEYWSDAIYGHDTYYYWDEISSLPGKEALLLGWNDCISISIDEHNTYKSDCIYFYDESFGGKLTAYGMYDLRRHSILKKNLIGHISTIVDFLIHLNSLMFDCDCMCDFYNKRIVFLAISLYMIGFGKYYYRV